MDVSKCEQIKSQMKSHPIAVYAKKLKPLVKQRYLEKISAIGIDIQQGEEPDQAHFSLIQITLLFLENFLRTFFLFH